MADTGRTVWADGLWSDDFWAAGLWAADEAVAVPDVTGETQSDGTSTLEDDGFTVAVETAYSSIIAAGLIISQVPAGGSSAAPGSSVTITVSLGDAPVQDAQPSGGWYMSWQDVQDIRRRRKKRREEREQELAELAEEVAEGSLSQTDGEIAELLRVQEAKDDARRERERLARTAEAVREAALSERVQQAAEKAAMDATRKNLDRFERELKRFLEDEELTMLIALMLADD